MSAAGTWLLAIRTPVGSMRVELVVTDHDGTLTGLARGQGQLVSIPELVLDEHADGTHLRWTQQVTKPLRLTLDFDVVLTGSTMSGTARAGRLPASSVSGTRVEAPAGGLPETPIEGLLALPTSELPYQADVVIRSFLLERPAGDVVVYNSPGLTSAAADIQQRGGLTRLLINHGHEAMYGDPGLPVPAFVHERDHRETARSMSVAGTFSTRQRIDDDLEVIPTPGHTPGTTSYLWDNGTHRFLFTGDFVWLENGEWKAVVLDPGLRGAYLDSLALVRELDFDVLVPWGSTRGHPGVDLVGRAEIRERVDAIIARVEAGENR